MGAWGITALESDTGLDILGFVREHLPDSGNAELSKLFGAMQKDDCRMYESNDGRSHTGPMTLAEILVKFLDRNIGDLDYSEEWAAQDNKFAALQSFIADKESLAQLRDYISETLGAARERAHGGRVWGGWFEEKDWQAWQAHMEALVERLGGLLALPEEQIQLVWAQEQIVAPAMEIQE